MAAIYLQNMVENLPQGCLPPAWDDLDLASFSPGKQLWPYQQTALHNALRALWKYFADPTLPTTRERKQAFMAWYTQFGLDLSLDLPLDDSTLARRQLAALLKTYYTPGPNGRLPYWQFINRMSFWMATGSGKTLVIVKMIEFLHRLMRRGEIPTRDILVLAHRDDLLDQLRQHVTDFNAGGDLYIRLHELRDYPEVKRTPTILQGQEASVFTYRSDNLSDERKDRIIDFRAYDNDGGWYILLDEAHKGDKEDSKRQHIYSILSRNGFLFNFSATFTDPRDVVTTVANFNLSEFIRQGHGKHLFVLQQEVRAFRREEDFSDADKQKIVLKALIMLAYTRHFEQRVRQVDPALYHRPLMMTLVNSVNTEDADLKLFFRQLVRIGAGLVDETIWQIACQELQNEFSGEAQFMYETGAQPHPDLTVIDSITPASLLGHVFNASGPGEMEILLHPTNRQEVAFKLKTGDEPFALVRIGDITDWLTRELSDFEINRRIADEGYFESLNRPDSAINILLGSRSFYEGWDSNRPNVITYINIGTAVEAKKFILQSIGRGVRIEPFKDQRKRLQYLAASGALTPGQHATFEQVKKDIQPLESVFVFGTNREALTRVISELDQENTQTGEREIALQINHEAVDGKLLLIPTYTPSAVPLYTRHNLARFAITPENLNLLTRYFDYVPDDRVLLALHDSTPEQIAALRLSLKDSGQTFRSDGERPYRNLDVLIHQTLSFFSIHNREFSTFKPLEDEINHFLHIKVALQQYADLEVKVQRVLNTMQTIHEAKTRFKAQQISMEEFVTTMESNHAVELFSSAQGALQIKHLANHYYVPVLVTNDERIAYIRSIIHVASEVKFLNDLEAYIKTPDNLFKAFDWWLFSRVDEHSDEVHIPYYYPFENRIAKFKPDFIFWLKKGDRYHILFVDPKGTSRTEYQFKVDGFRALFEENGLPKVFHYHDLDVSVHVRLYTSDRQFSAEGYRRYWFDSIAQALTDLL